MDEGFDYELLGTCQMGVPIGGRDVADCGEPACYQIWWKGDKSDAMLVCMEHFKFFKESEKEVINNG